MGTLSSLHARLAAGALLLSAFAAAPAAKGEGFATPAYTEAPFAADGVFLGETERRALLDALSALATRFRDLARVDGDVRGKAIGLALALDPLDFTVREAHRSLDAGAPPPEIVGFDSLSAVSESLWIAAERLLRPPMEPEEAALAPLLMELSLLAHPEPPGERLASFGKAAGEAPLPWAGFVPLSPEGGLSARRADELATRARLAASGALEPPPGVVAEPDPFAAVPPRRGDPAMKGPDGAEEQRPRRRREEAEETLEEPVSLSLAAVLHVAAVEGGATLGEFSLTLREPAARADVEPFPFLELSPAREYPFLPILARGDGVPLELLQIPGDYPATRGWAWPDGWIAEAEYRSGSALSGPRRLSRVDGLLPAALLLEAAFTKREPNPAFLVAGEVDGLPGGTLGLRGGAAPALEAASSSGRDYLVLPDDRLEELVEHLQRSGRLEALFGPEWIAVDGLEELFPLLLEATPAPLLRASEIFAEIEAASSRTPLAELARNERVQERLGEILELFPRHLSARAMLEYGTRPIPPGIAFAATVSAVEDLLAPLEPLREPGAPVGGLRGELEGIKTGLFQMRPGIPPEARDYFTKAEDVHEAAERFLSLNNPATSTADQRRRELAEAFARLEEARERLLP